MQGITISTLFIDNRKADCEIYQTFKHRAEVLNTRPSDEEKLFKILTFRQACGQ